MTAFPKYPKYKDSGVEWLGDVPEQWNAEKGKWLFTLMARPPRQEDEIVTAFRDGQVTLRINRRTEGFTNAIKEHGYQGIRKGDLVIHAMDAFAGAIGVSDSDGKSTPVYSACVPRQQNSVNPYFYAYLLRHMAHSGFITTLAKGIRERSTNFSFTDFAGLRLPLPAKREQDSIVAFLDEKTAEIDTLIAKKQRQIELLDEQKAILINRAVTRGVPSKASAKEVELQDSGIPWIGPIPKHWQVAPLYGRCEVRLGKMLDGSRITGRRLQPYLRNTDVQWFKINTDSLPMMDFSVSEYERYSVRRGDLLVCEGGEPGRAAIWESDDLCFFQKALHRVRPIKGDHPRFLLYLFRNAVTQAAFSGFEKATIAHLTGEQLRRFRFAFPPPAEQKQIAAHLDKVGDAFETARTKLESQIQTLQTLRSTLIAHAVTGKIAIPAATV
jgi:type I restriction enzyme S subunit